MGNCRGPAPALHRQGAGSNREKVRRPKGLHLAKADGAALCKLAVAVLAERLKDIDAALKAFGCEPPKSAPL